MTKQHTRTLRDKQAGFTVVELMVATTVFSVILVVITMGVLHFTHSYYKGVYTSMTQATARTISDTVVQATQFGSDLPVTYTYVDANYVLDTPHYFCAGGYVFVFDIGEKYEVGGAAEGMYMQPIPSTGCGIPGVSTGRRQLLGNRMRVTYVNFEQSGSAYTFDIKIAYGDDELLEGSTGPEKQCTVDAGSEYCAVARITATAERRKG